MEFLSLILALIGIGLALAVPLRIEYLRRPILRIERAADANQPESPAWRIVHVNVINEPLAGRWTKRWLVRNTAPGCTVRVLLRSRSDRKETVIAGKWSARPQPLEQLPVAGGAIASVFSWEKIPDAISLDLSPGRGGQPVAIAIKHDGESQAYAFDPRIYIGNPAPLRNPEFKLPDREYEVIVTAESGEIWAEEGFVLQNEGTQYTGLELIPLPK